MGGGRRCCRVAWPRYRVRARPAPSPGAHRGRAAGRDPAGRHPASRQPADQQPADQQPADQRPGFPPGAAITAARDHISAAADHLRRIMTAGPSPLWYATRATGVMALVLLTATVVLGVAGTARLATPHWPRMITAQLHRNLSLLAVAFVAAHVVTTVLDPYAPIGWISAIVPFASPYRTLWLGLGTVAFDLLLPVVVPSLLRAPPGYPPPRAGPLPRHPPCPRP